MTVGFLTTRIQGDSVSEQKLQAVSKLLTYIRQCLKIQPAGSVKLTDILQTVSAVHATFTAIFLHYHSKEFVTRVAQNHSGPEVVQLLENIMILVKCDSKWIHSSQIYLSSCNLFNSTVNS
jgi:hypothetical protein